MLQQLGASGTLSKNDNSPTLKPPTAMLPSAVQSLIALCIRSVVQVFLLPQGGGSPQEVLLYLEVTGSESPIAFDSIKRPSEKRKKPRFFIAFNVNEVAIRIFLAMNELQVPGRSNAWKCS